jgi:hypothetical protein
MILCFLSGCSQPLFQLHRDGQTRIGCKSCDFSDIGVNPEFQGVESFNSHLWAT